MSDILNKVKLAIESYNTGEFETLTDACSHHDAILDISNIVISNMDLFNDDDFVSEELFNTRLTKCVTCDDLSGPLELPNICKLCSCPIKVISSLSIKSCPKGEW